MFYGFHCQLSCRCFQVPGPAKEYQGKANVLFIDVLEDGAAGDRFKVRMVPTQIFFDAKGKEIKRHIGFMDKADIVKELKAAGLR
jgi:thioredoxin 1